MDLKTQMGGGKTKVGQAFAFTLAEVLITLVIIGVIAAITVPTLMNNYRKQQYVSGLKKAYATVENGFKLYVANEGGTGIQDTTMWKGIEEFITSGSGLDKFENEVKKVFSTSQTRFILDDNDTNAIKYKYMKNEVEPRPITQSLQATLNDGSFLYIAPSPYNKAIEPYGYANSEEELRQKGAKFTTFYGDIYIDINGEAKPNTYGRDFFYFALTGNGTLVPGGSKQYCLIRWGNECSGSNGAGWNETNSADNNCITNGEYGSAGIGCVARIIDEGWEMKY